MFGLSAGAAAAIIGGTAVAGAAISANAASSAANKQVAASDRAAQLQSQAGATAIDEQRRQYDATRADFAPWRLAGQNALAQLNGFDSNAYIKQNPDVGAAGMDGYQHYLQYGQNEGRAFTGGNAFQTDPGYNFARSEGQRGLFQGAAAAGRSRAGGNALKALTEFNQNLANQQYGNWWNRTAQIAGFGQNATNATSQAGQQTAGNIANIGTSTAGNMGNALMAGGDARASGIMGAANSWSNNLNAGLNTGLLYSGGYFNRRP